MKKKIGSEKVTHQIWSTHRDRNHVNLKARLPCPHEKEKDRKSAGVAWLRRTPPTGVGLGQQIYLHSTKDTNWPDLYLNMITMT